MAASAKKSELIKLRDVLDQVEDRVSRAILDAVATLHDVVTDEGCKVKDRIDAASKIIDMARAKTPLVQVNVSSAPQIGPRDFSGASVPRLFEGPALLPEPEEQEERERPEPKVVSAAPHRRAPMSTVAARREVQYEPPVAADEQSPGPTLDQAQKERRQDMFRPRVTW